MCIFCSALLLLPNLAKMELVRQLFFANQKFWEWPKKYTYIHICVCVCVCTLNSTLPCYLKEQFFKQMNKTHTLLCVLKSTHFQSVFYCKVTKQVATPASLELGRNKFSSYLQKDRWLFWLTEEILFMEASWYWVRGRVCSYDAT